MRKKINTLQLAEKLVACIDKHDNVKANENLSKILKIKCKTRINNTLQSLNKKQKSKKC